MVSYTKAATTALRKVTSIAVLSMLLVTGGRAQEKPIKITDSKLSSINYAVESLEHWVNKLAEGDKDRAAKLLGDHDKIVVRFNRLPTTDSAQYQYVRERLASLRKTIEQRSQSTQPNTSTTQQPNSAATNQRAHPALAGIASRLTGLEQDAVRYGMENLKGRQRVKSDLATLAIAFARIPASKHPQYQAVQQRLGKLQRSLQPSDGPLDMTDAEVSVFVNSMQQKYGERITLPRARDMLKNRELTAGEVDDFVSKIRTFSEHAGRDLPKLKQIVEATGQGAYWADWVETKALENLQVEMANLKTAIDRAIEFGISNAKNLSELDIERNNYAFSNDSVLKSNEALFSRTERTIQQAIRLEQLLGLPATWSKKNAELEKYVSVYREKVAAASKARKLPDEVGTQEQHKIALGVFKNQKYGVGKVIKQIVNSKVVPRDRIEHKEFAGKLETTVRRWEEFQVTTVELEGGKYYVYVNNLAKFSRAPNPTPIGTWILKQRFKSGEVDSARVTPKR